MAQITLFIDADACPVTREALDCARAAHVPCVIAGNSTQNLMRHVRASDPTEEPPRGGRRWQGGAFSRLRLGRVGMRSGEEQADEALNRATRELEQSNSQLEELKNEIDERRADDNVAVLQPAIFVLIRDVLGKNDGFTDRFVHLPIACD